MKIRLLFRSDEKMDFNNALTKILGNDKSIDEVHVDYRVIDEIVKIATN